MSESKIRAYAQEKGFHRQTLERWLGWEIKDRAALQDLAVSLKASENHLRDMMDWLEEIALRDHVGIGDILAAKKIEELKTDPRLGRADRLKQIKEQLRRLRYPRLAATEEEIHKRVQALKLHPQIRLSVPPGLEGGRLQVEFAATSALELRALAEKLCEAVAAPSVAEICHGDFFGAAKKKLYLMRHRGEFFKKCPGSDGQVCCNYFVINFASNCPMDCSYCYLQEYLQDNAALKVFSNVGDLIDEAEQTLQKHRGVFFRIGTGEITDSLALEPYTGMVRELIPYFAEQANVLLELKTKSDCVESLLDLDPKGRVVVAWSMNPQPVIDLEEHDTASFSERLSAARRCQEAGYHLGFHFDPMIEYEGWQADYQGMLETIFAVVDWRRLSWLSLGVLRETPGLKRMMRLRYPQSRLLTGEQVLCPDGKMRYFQPLRIEMYRKMVEWIRRQAPTVKIYLCMESREVWQQVFGFAPACEKELGNQMAPLA